MTDLSVIVPLFNEEDNVELLYSALDRTLSRLGLDYEVLLVDDGSRDRTVERAAALARRDPHLRVVKLRRNYGQTPAMAAGIATARGRILITMDGDLQNDPEDIPAFLAKIDEGYDLVVGWRHKRQDRLISRKIPSRIANWLIGKVTGVPIRDNGCSLKAYRAAAIRAVPLYSEMHRFIPAMATTVGCRVAQIRVRHHARRFGASKYGLSRIYKVLLDMLVIKTLISFAFRPLLWFAAFAVPAGLLGGVLVLASLLPVLAGADAYSVALGGTGLLLCALSLFLIAGGAVGELITRTTGMSTGANALVTARLQEPVAVETPETGGGRS
jgi:glycosyltransferase involved in cell wall biosynthesis